MDPYESFIEKQIREAQERGEFDNLPGAGKPLHGLESQDPDWWVKQLVRREGLDLTDALPPVIALRKEADGFPESLLDLRTEESVRAVLEDFNRRVKLDRLRPAVGPFPPMLARTVDVDQLVGEWNALRAERIREDRARREHQDSDVATGSAPTRHGSLSWWRRLTAAIRGR